jgi:hypothetical protein
MPTYERLDYGSSDGCQIGGASTDKVAFYGAVPVIQRPYTAAVHNTTGVAVSASFGATQLAAIQEIQKTLIALGIWATA